jgi:hypothetical protein
MPPYSEPVLVSASNERTCPPTNDGLLLSVLSFAWLEGNVLCDAKTRSRSNTPLNLHFALSLTKSHGQKCNSTL